MPKKEVEMFKTRRAFTLTELLIIVIILGALAAAGAPSYIRTMETNKSIEAIGLMSQIASAQKSCRVNNITSQDTSCPGAELTGGHVLVQNKYLANRNWTKESFKYASSLPTTCSAVGQVASATGLEACTGNKKGSQYGFFYSLNGECRRAYGTLVDCPKMHK